MGETFVALTPFIIGSILVPLHITLVILLLSSPTQGLSKAISLVAGITTVRLLQGLVFGLILSPSSSGAGGKSPVVSTLLLVLGILLLIAAYKKWRNEEDPDAPPPKWMAMLDTLTPLKAFGMGAILVLMGAKFWVFTLGAIGVIEEAALGQPSGAILFVLFVLLAQSLLILAILLRAILPKQSKFILGTISSWLTQYNRPIVVVVSLVFGLLFLFQGVSGLMA